MTAPDERELARGYLRTADADLAAVAAYLDDRGVSDRIIGFHCQQAVEKALKAVLAARDEDVPRTHALGFLLERVRAAGVELPDDVDRADWLGPWAVEFRYPDVAAEGDRPRRGAGDRTYRRALGELADRVGSSAAAELREQRGEALALAARLNPWMIRNARRRARPVARRVLGDGREPVLAGLLQACAPTVTG